MLIFLLSFLFNYHLNAESFLPYPFKKASIILQILFGQKDLCLNTCEVQDNWLLLVFLQETENGKYDQGFIQPIKRSTRKQSSREAF